MWDVILFSFFVLSLSACLGGMLISRHSFPEQYMIFSMTLLFMLIGYIGALLGGLILSWVAIRFIQVVLGVIIIIFTLFVVGRFHQSLGYFHGENKLQWGLLLFLFLLIGIEYSSLEISNWIIIIFGTMFLGGILAGAAMAYQLLIKSRASHILFLPALLLVFIGIIKLV